MNVKNAKFREKCKFRIFAKQINEKFRIFSTNGLRKSAKFSAEKNVPENETNAALTKEDFE